MAGFLFRLETADGAPAEPSTFSASVPNWRDGDTIHFGDRTLRVTGDATMTRIDRPSSSSRTCPEPPLARLARAP